METLDSCITEFVFIGDYRAVVVLFVSVHFYDGLGYQENILPKYQVRMGNTVYLAAPQRVDDIKSVEAYETDLGFKVVRVHSTDIGIPFIKTLNNGLSIKGIIERIKPDIIFIQNLRIKESRHAIKYKKKNPHVKIVFDNHNDYYNTEKMGRTLGLKLDQYIRKLYFMKNNRYFDRFYGVTPWRIDYIVDRYGIKRNKCDLLVMGADDDYVRIDEREMIRDDVMKKHRISKDSFLIATGGKIDKGKNLDLLIDAIKRIDTIKVKLLVFGRFENGMDYLKETCSLEENVEYIGWIPSEKAYDYFLAADLVVFPGTHSVLWEQACACGTPGVYKKWFRMDHIDIGGNVEFVNNDDSDEIKSKIELIYNNYEKYTRAALGKKRRKFLYSNIAKKSLETVFDQ